MLLTPSLHTSGITVSFLRSLLSGEAVDAKDSLQERCVRNRVQNDGQVIVQMYGNRYNVVPSPENAAQFHLVPLTVTINDVPGQPAVGFRAHPLSWGWKAFESSLQSGEIVFV